MHALTRWEHWADRQLHRQHAACSAVFVASDGMRERLKSAGVTRIVRAPFAVHSDLLRIARRPHSGPKGILYAGRLDGDKEFTLVLDVLTRLLERTDVRVTIAGAGRCARRVAAIEHPRFRYLGHVIDRRVLAAVYAANDVLLAPGRFETFGMSALEGAAAGLLVVGPSEGGTGELLSQCRSPLTFPAGSSAAFLETIVKAIEADHSGVLERARALARQHGSWDEAVARHVGIYLSMLGCESSERVGRTA
jgi:glycosyltransferase involved in cell wall biosynthesis